MQTVEMDKVFDPKEFESRVYQFWTDRNLFAPEAALAARKTLRLARDPDAQDEPFVVVIPPPNVTGVLHLGHGLNNSLQDILIRYRRMLGEEALWVPGTDHAGIATQSVVEKKLRAQGVRRQDLGREKFVEETWKVKDEHHRIITEQLKKIGSSCDWTRERFTLDEGLSDAVKEVFVTLYERGLIYKGTYLVNWSTGMQSALSDDEVVMKEVRGKFYKLRYPLADGSGELRIATTRPETMLGDTAVMVHPEDERYAGLVGKMVRLPLTGREIPVIADAYVDREFGTGVVKVTPAHDPNDWQVGKRHKLEEINIMNPDGTLNEAVPEKYRGMKMAEARKAVVADLEALGLYDGADDHVHQVGHCYRTDTVIEPYLSEQWFVRMEGMAQKALGAWERGEVKFYPQRWENTYKAWLTNTRDWCISRQLWWGHRIPAWTDEDTGELIVSRTDPALDPANAGRRLKQDEDVLDTWFSSWLWPFSVMGWPEKTPDLAKFYPTSALVTGYDIIFFWVARMIMAGLEFTGKAPFTHICMTGLVRDKQGRKMSKSLGNGVDPLDIVDTYGADALKFTLGFLYNQGQDILLDKETFGMGSRFANKIWNASRYILSNIGGRNFLAPADIVAGKHGGLKAVDRWILHRLGEAAATVRGAMKAYRYNEATNAAYEFFWNDFCDWYIEASKLASYSPDDAEKDRGVSLLLHVLEEGLKLLHPFLPMITEEIFQKLPQVSDATVRAALGLPEGRSLMVEGYPRLEAAVQDAVLADGFAGVQELVRSIRAIRSEFTVPPSVKVKAVVRLEAVSPHHDLFRGQDALVANLCGLESLVWTTEAGRPAGTQGTIATVGRDFEAWLHVREHVDVPSVVARLEKNIEREGKALTAMEGKLKNEGFLAKAGEEVVAKEREKAAELGRQIEKMRAYVEELKA